MAAAIVDLDINEGDTFLMTLEGWENADNTIPIDWSADTFKGSFEFNGVNIPMVLTLYPSTGPIQNVLEATVACSLMVDLPSKGKYDIDQMLPSGECYRLIQGNVRVSQEVTK